MTASDEPKRAKDLRERADPRWTKSSTDNDEPSRAKVLSAKAEPK